MTRAEFIAEFADVLDVPAEEILPETDLKAIRTWDSVAFLSVMVLIDENFGIVARPETFSKAERFADILSVVENAFSPE